MFEYKEIAGIKGSAIPGLNEKLRDKDFTSYGSLQFGGGDNDIIYFAFDCEKKFARHDRLYVYIPKHKTYGTPTSIYGRKKKTHILFKLSKLKGSFNKINVTYDITINSRTIWEKHLVDADVEITCKLEDKGKFKKCRFILKGSPKCIMQPAVLLKPERLLAPPQLSARWDHRSKPPHVRCKISMGKYALTPETGLLSRARFVIRDKNDHVKMRKSIKIQPSGARSEFTYKPKRNFKAARPYKADVTVDLNPIFGFLASNSITSLRQ